MNDPILTKQWEVVEIQLRQASELLNAPRLFKLKEKPFKEYQHYKDNGELESAMEKLEQLAKEKGCKTGFWRRLKKAAIQMNLESKADEYELQFQKALNDAI